jgi:hypothetical protein
MICILTAATTVPKLGTGDMALCVYYHTTYRELADIWATEQFLVHQARIVSGL